MNNLEIYKRNKGLSYQELGKRMGITRQCAYSICQTNGKSLYYKDKEWAKRLNISENEFLKVVNSTSDITKFIR